MCGLGRALRLHWPGMEERIAEERARIEAEYRRVLESSVGLEKRIRDRWPRKGRDKNERIAALEARVAALERRMKEVGC